MSDIINTIQPGKPLTDTDKEALAKANAEATAEAHRLAAEHRAREAASGHQPPAVMSVAESIKSKLSNEEFQKPEAGE